MLFFNSKKKEEAQKLYTIKTISELKRKNIQNDALKLQLSDELKKVNDLQLLNNVIKSVLTITAQSAVSECGNIDICDTFKIDVKNGKTEIKKG